MSICLSYQIPFNDPSAPSTQDQVTIRQTEWSHITNDPNTDYNIVWNFNAAMQQCRNRYAFSTSI